MFRIYGQFIKGAVSQSIENDLDARGIERERVQCTVTATDKGNHTVTTTLQMDFLEENDNSPVLNKNDYDTNVRQDANPGTGCVTTMTFIK